MESIVDKVIEKFVEYNVGILTDYETEDRGHCVVTPGMLVFVDNDDNTISIAFQADQKPEDVATNLLILNEIEDITHISIMESFIHDSNQNFISGQEAHDLVKQDIITQAFQKVAKQQAYNEILKSTDCFNC